MAGLGRIGFLAIAVVFHLMYILSIFDIYFVSPIVSGMKDFSVDAPEAPAKRLVLFVGDGLRADRAFQSFPDPSPANQSTTAQEIRPLAPFLRSRVLEHGTFGVSHTRVPTESRPGHVALIAGLYEDVSAVTTGWKLNPVNFDSVFNRSRHTWSWGSPDILPMFQEGAVPGRVDAYMYGAEAEDYTLDATHLDTWVFERVKGLFEEAKTNTTLNAALREDKNVFFLHLLGIDMTGHAYRPYSREYLHNIKVVDKGVQEITELIEEFYGDGKTAFVFTADHGMSDWGSHGDGHPDNTRTPLIAWGSGVAPPVTVNTGVARGHEDGFSSDWGLDHVSRHDVAQADVAALMAYLAGLAFPVNSVGELPLAYVKASPKAKAAALLANAKEILEMYRVKEEQKKSTELRYRPFPGFKDEEHSVEHRIARIKQMIDDGEAEEAISGCEELMKLGLEGLRYLQTYDWLFLRALVTTGYLGWIAFAITSVIDLYVLREPIEPSRTTFSIMVFSSALLALYSVLYVQRSPWTYYAYGIFPVMLWEEVYARRSALEKGRDVLLGHISSTGDYTSLVLNTFISVAFLEALVQSYFHREVFTVCYLAAIAWPAFYGMDFVREHQVLVATWACSCGAMSLFTLLPVVKVESINLILLGGLLMFAVGALYVLFEKSIMVQSKSTKAALASSSFDRLSRTVLGVQTGLIALAMYVTRSSTASLQARLGLPLGTQVVGWTVLVASLTVPFLHGLQPNNHYLHRLVVIFLSFAPTFIILTISYEGLFYFAFCTTLVTWVRLEHHIYTYTNSLPHSSPSASPTSQQDLNPSGSTLPAATASKATKDTATYRSLTLSDARISLFSLYLLQSAFFSTGNIASISSFSLDAVYRLLPIFDPFSQGALLVLKLLIPFFLISANLGILNRRLRLPGSALFGVVMAVGDYLTVRFFWSVRDEGSWLDIGTSITNFCIASGLCVFVSALEGVSEVLIGGVEFGDEETTHQGAGMAKAANGGLRDMIGEVKTESRG
ncbi:GPI ethanolamine phosphate transferase 1 [Coniosporium apollinis CBS 100218]|uniref:GPI ethanolamine phosphate transferase 1 n=1 Tax=Coniosporium apollinis (strain CBS 100218) TaxID=1168221 RepID=R7YX01_CONA1|nr:GPI ethanolamine phosphate transferase 1 [Coniosporium apollinis CBS 100218]EON66176.1 GPI ethanolamine phosphate transferase 1 [Coniosporium apollinis CBS 100218]